MLVDRGAEVAGGEFRLAESAVIAQYLIDKYGGENAADLEFVTRPSAEDKARGAIVVDQIGGRIVKGFYGLLMAQDEAAQALAAAELTAAIAGTCLLVHTHEQLHGS